MDKFTEKFLLAGFIVMSIYFVESIAIAGLSKNIDKYIELKRVENGILLQKIMLENGMEHCEVESGDVNCNQENNLFCANG